MYRAVEVEVPKTPQFTFSHNHLCYTLSAERLAADKILLLQSRKSIERRSNEKENRSSDQAAGINKNAKPLNQTHDAIDSGSYQNR